MPGADSPATWRDTIDVAGFVQDNVTPYDGDAAFLTGPTHRTERSGARCSAVREERLAASTTSTRDPRHHRARPRLHRPRSRADRRTADQRAAAPGHHARRRPADGGDRAQGVRVRARPGRARDLLDRTARRTTTGSSTRTRPTCSPPARSHIITGLPDAYGRGRIIGDYRRVALYGVDRLIAERRARKAALDAMPVRRGRHPRPGGTGRADPRARRAEDDGRRRTATTSPARPTPRREAIQWLYFAYLAATKEQNGAAMSLGRTSTFVDVYLQRDLDEGTLTETGAQELIDDFVIKLRIIRFLRTPEYDELFSGDPTWVTESLGGIGADGRPLVTRTSFRYLQTLYNLGPAPEPNLTVLWSPALPEGFKRFCAQVSLDTSAIQYENDDLIRPAYSDDTAIACCVSAMRVGKDMQFFGARANLAKALLYAINGGRDEISGDQVAPPTPPVDGDVLDYDEVLAAFDRTLDWLAETYVDALNVIHYMHDKYAYERLEMALHDYPVHRFLATGIAGLSVAVDSLSAIKYAQVKVLRDDDRTGRRLRRRRRLPGLRQQRRPRRRDRRRPGRAVHGQDPAAAAPTAAPSRACRC